MAELVFKKTGDFFCRNVPDSRPCDAQERGKMTPKLVPFFRPHLAQGPKRLSFPARPGYGIWRRIRRLLSE